MFTVRRLIRRSIGKAGTQLASGLRLRAPAVGRIS
jgi:hypothetical protein